MDGFENIKNIIINAYGKHPESQIQDMVKLLYQSEFAGGHMIEDRELSLERLKNEYSSIDKNMASQEAFEDIGGGLYRLNLRALSSIGLSLETVNRFFCQTANGIKGNVKGFEEKIKVFSHCCEEGMLPFDIADVLNYKDNLKEQGYPPVSHSLKYRETYSPAYRIIKTEYRDYIEVFQIIDPDYYKGITHILAIDGQCGSGKSILAGLISSVYDCNVFHMDDFFLRPEQRTLERMNETGGNVDYERFSEEVIKGLISRKHFSYKKFDCKSGRLGETVNIEPKRLSIIEGSYSMHPALIKNYDLKVLLKISAEEQKKRILKREGETMYNRFVNEWIPLETKYFSEFNIEDKCDLVLNM